MADTARETTEVVLFFGGFVTESRGLRKALAPRPRSVEGKPATARSLAYIVMILDTPIAGVKVIELERICDARGHFARTFCAKDFERHGMTPTVAQANLSFSHRQGTIRGLHYQIQPLVEAKLIRCTRGAIMDIVIDLRPESATFLRHFAIELTADNYRALYIPERFANGYQALTDEAEAAYSVSEFYAPGYERGLRFDDPRLALSWATQPTVVSEKDRNWRLLDDERIAAIRLELTL